MPTSSSNSTIIEAASNYQIIDIINKGLAYAILVAGFLCVIFIFIGGISFILSGGAEDKIKKAVSTIRYAIIGLIVTILSVVIVQAVGKAIGLDIVKYIEPKAIYETIQGIGGTSSSTSSLD